METPIKMSQFEIPAVFPSGSYFIAVIPTGSAWANVRVTPDQAMALISSTRWKTVPLNSFSPGNDGDEARDTNGNYYLHTGGIWRKIQLGQF